MDPAGAEVKVVGTMPVALEPQEMKRIEAWVVVPEVPGGQQEAIFRLAFDDGTTETVIFPLLGPQP